MRTTSAHLCCRFARAVLAQDAGAKADPGFAKILPCLQRLSYLTAGGAGDGLKIVVGAK